MGTIAPASASWEPLGETFYRKQDIYSMQWPIDNLSDYRVATARWGGPIAIIRDDRKPILLGRGATLGKPKISIYSSSGGLIQTITWDSPSRILALGWILAESLVVLTQDGTYRLYSLTPNPSPTTTSAYSSTPLPTAPPLPSYTQHSLGPDAQESGVLEAKIYEDGMVVLLGNLTFVEVRGWQRAGSSDDPGDGSGVGVGGKVQTLPSAGLAEPPDCWAVIIPELSHTRGVEVLIGVGESVLRLDEIEVVDQHVTRGPFLSITPSPNGHFLALLSHNPTSSTSTPQLWVASSDFTRSLSEFDLGNEGEVGAPGQVVWCGNNTVVVAWERTVVMVGPFGETLKYFYSDPVHVVGEIDGTRIISTDSCEFLQMVPQSSQDVFRPGSTSPSAILFEATQLFANRSPKADEYIRSIRSDLVGAIDTCIDAAGKEFEAHWQKSLLQAASFGKTFLDLYNPSEFIQMSQTLRVLNAVRYYEIGIPLTYDQYQTHSPAHLISRLTSRSQHLLALRISSFLKLSPAPVLKHWAQVKISAVRGGVDNEDEICKSIVEKLQDQVDVSCADVAQTAWSKGQVGLATKLLDHEPRASKQVPLLLSMKEDDLALVKAIESGDPNLVYTVLLHLKRVHALGDFFRFVDHKPDAAALLQVYAKENDVEMLRDYYYQDDRRKETACLALDESIVVPEIADKLVKIKQAQKSFGEDKDSSFEAKMVEDQLKLLTFQQTLEQETPGKTFVGLSVNESVRACIVNGLTKKADKIKSDFKIPDKRFWYVKMKALIEVRDWDGLETFAKSKKSPIGYEPWLNTSSQLDHNVKLSLTFRDVNRRIGLSCMSSVENGSLAGQECLRKSDRTKLMDLRNRCPNTVIAAQLDQLLEEERGHGGGF